MKNYIPLVTSFFCALAVAAPAYCEEEPAAFPNHDITLFDLSVDDQGYHITNPTVVANGPGYDNQPHFSGDGKTLFYTTIENGGGDTWKWNVGSHKATRLMTTPEGEYSPTEMPFDTASLSMIRVEQDGTQRLWKFEPGAGFSLIFETVKPVGYHAWSGKNIAMFILGEPASLQVTRFGEEKTEVVAEGIGRCIQKIPGRNAISYTRLNESTATVHRYDFDSKTTAPLVTLPQGHEDYVWYSKEVIVGSDGQRLLVRSTADNDSWRAIDSPAGLNLQGITRLAISPDQSKIAVVHLIGE